MALRTLLVAAFLAAEVGFACFMPLAASAQSSSTENAPTNPTANDPSYGTSMSPTTMTNNPVAMNPQAARKEGTAPPTSSGSKPATTSK